MPLVDCYIIAFICWATTLPPNIGGSLRPTFIPAQWVGPAPFCLCTQEKSLSCFSQCGSEDQEQGEEWHGFEAGHGFHEFHKKGKDTEIL